MCSIIEEILTGRGRRSLGGGLDDHNASGLWQGSVLQSCNIISHGSHHEAAAMHQSMRALHQGQAILSPIQDSTNPLRTCCACMHHTQLRLPKPALPHPLPYSQYAQLPLLGRALQAYVWRAAVPIRADAHLQALNPNLGARARGKADHDMHARARSCRHARRRHRRGRERKRRSASA